MLKKLGIALGCALLLSGMTFSPATSHAAYPERAITLIVPFGAGGSADVVARFIAMNMEKRLGKTVIVKNMVGTGGIMGTAAIADSRPDGYTIGMMPNGPFVMQTHLRSVPYDLSRFDYIGRTTNAPLIVEVSKKKPWTSLQDMAEAMKTAPAKHFFAHAGIGSQIHIAMVHLMNDLGLPTVKGVSTKDDPEAMQNMAADRVQVYVSQPSLLPLYDIKPLAILSEQRDPDMPDIPTAREQGVDIVYSQWMALVTPKGVPEDILNFLSKELEAISSDPEYIAQLATMNLKPAYLNRAETKAFIEKEDATYKELINTMIKPSMTGKQ